VHYTPRSIYYKSSSIYQHRAASVRFWLAAGADPNLLIDNELPLAVAVGEGVGIMQGLLDAGARINSTNSDGEHRLVLGGL
jgi:hypothetical protein